MYHRINSEGGRVRAKVNKINPLPFDNDAQHVVDDHLPFSRNCELCEVNISTWNSFLKLKLSRKVAD